MSTNTAPDFLELVESIRSEEASAERLYNRADGNRIIRGRNNPRYMKALAEATRLIADVYTGKKPMHRLQEAMSTSDFPLLFGDVIDRQLLANYKAWQPTYRNYAKIGSVRDFRTVKRFYVNGGEATLAQVAEQSEYPDSKLDDGKFSFAVQKYGRRIPFSWESMINDDLDALKDAPMRFAKAAGRTEEKFATALFVSSTGPNATFFSNTNKNLVNPTNGAVATNPALSIAGLQDAFTVLMKQVDADGEPIVIEAVELVVPPALKVTANNILNATELWLTEAGGTTNQQVHVMNWMRQLVRVNVNPYLPIINTTSGSTAWYLFANPSDGRPAMEVSFLRGHESPELFMKSPNAVRVGSAGLSDPMNGDFDTDSLEYKIRHVLGGTLCDPKMGVASTGTGS